MVTMVRPIAISGEIKRDGGRPLGALFKHQLHGAAPSAAKTASAHQQAELLAVGVRGRQRLRQPAVKHHRDAVGDLGEFIEVLAGHQHRGAGGGEIEQGLANDRGGAGVDAPGRLADHQHHGVAEDFAADDEFLQVAAGQARGFGVALGLAHVERRGRAVDRRQASRRY